MKPHCVSEMGSPIAARMTTLKMRPHRFPIAGLMDSDQGTVERPRADGDLIVLPLCHGAPQLFQFFDRRREVRVAEQAPLAARFEHPVPDGIAFAAIAGIAQHPDIRIVAARKPSRLGRAIRRTVVHNDDFMESPIGIRRRYCSIGAACPAAVTCSL